MPTISFASTKGGAGKSTGVVALGSVLANEGLQTVIIDADPKQRTYKWSMLSQEDGYPGLPDNLTVLPYPGASDLVLDAIEKASSESDFVIVDVEGSENTTMVYAIAGSDFVVVPCKASMADAEDAIDTIRVIKAQEKVTKSRIPHAVLFSEIDAAFITNIQRDIMEQFKGQSIDMFDAEMIRRVAFREPNSLGGTLYDLPSSVSGLNKAIENAETFAEELIEKLREAS